MDDYDDFYIQWIISDYTPFTYNGKNYFITTPSRKYRFQAERIYHDFYKMALDEGLYREDDLTKLLERYRIWNENQEVTLKSLTDKVEDLKVSAFDNYTKTSQIKLIKAELRETEKYVDAMLKKKHSFDNVTAKSTAVYAKHNFLIGCSIRRSAKQDVSLWSKPVQLVNKAYIVLSEYQLDDNDYRDLSQCGLWRNIWATRKGTNLFGRPVTDYSIAQRNLIAWSNMYDNIYKNMDAPPDRVVEDHDMLDGWLIKQRRKRESETNKHFIESNIPGKIANCDEVYIMCDPENIEDVFNMNDIAGKVGWTKRMAQIKRSGFIRDNELVDTQEQIRAKATELRKI